MPSKYLQFPNELQFSFGRFDTIEEYGSDSVANVISGGQLERPLTSLIFNAIDVFKW